MSLDTPFRESSEWSNPLDPLHRGFDRLRWAAPIPHWPLRTTRQPVIMSVQRI
jgi:hypothetical protein